MSRWLIIIGVIYVGILIALSIRSKRRNKTTQDFTLAGRNIGLVLGFMTFAASLFSTFTMMGMPDFVRMNGIGAWIFLALSDAGMVFLIVWFGSLLRRKVAQKGFKGMSGLLQSCYQNRWTGLLYSLGVFIFLIPYVAIQIRGIAIFMVQAFPNSLPAWGWSVSIVILMLIYSAYGGLKAIIYADLIQGLVLLFVVWVIAFSCVKFAGGFSQLFKQTEVLNPELLSTPGPKGLLSAQFLIASFIAILMIPVTQPHLSSRLVIIKSTAVMHRMAVAVGTFAMLIIFPTILIGLYGAIKYPDASVADFLGHVLLHDQVAFVASAAIVGLLAAGMSASEAQLFALGNELHGIFGNKGSSVFAVRIALVVFAAAALTFSLVSSDQLVMLARVSFAGTSLLGPLVLTGILSNKPQGRFLVISTGIGLIIFICSILELIPQHIGPIRMDLFLVVTLGMIAIFTNGFTNRKLNPSIPSV